MIYAGKYLDPVSLWEEFVDFPDKVPDSGFAPLVVCPNPEHGSSKRHFQVNLDKPLVHCFAQCGISGTYEKAISMIQGGTEREARRLILKHCRVKLGPTSKRKMRDSQGRVKRARSAVEADKSSDLRYSTFIPEAGHSYLGERGIDAQGIATFEIGWDKDENRVVIPAKDEREVLRFLIKRAIRPRDWPKYLYTEGFPKTSLLFGACLLDRDQVRSDGLVLVEGSLDAVRLHQHGIRNVVAVLGTGVSEKQAAIISRLKPRRVVMLFDKDGAGWRSMQITEHRVKTTPLFTCLYPSDKSDPAELSRKEAVRIIENAMPLVKFKQRLPKRLREREVAHG